jgi:putative ABC transport system permease protein
MSSWGILFRNLLYFRKQHAGACLGAALCSMVLVGALTVGDSVRATLSALADERIGKADLALLATDGFFRDELAKEIEEELGGPVVVAPVVMTRGTVSLPDGSVRVSNVQVLGVDERFWSLAPDPTKVPSREGKGFFANSRLYNHLKLADGERIILRVEEPGLFSRDAPLSGERDNKFVSFRETLLGDVPVEGFGSFGLQGNQREPLTLFVPIGILQKKMFRSFDEEKGSAKFANFILLGNPKGEPVDLTMAKKALDKKWTLSDAGISIKSLRDSSQWSVRSRQVFLSKPLEKAVREIDPDTEGVLTYLVNAIEKPSAEGNGSASIPYSMVSSVRPGSLSFVPEDFKKDEIILNEWAARDLNATIGSELSLRYFSVGERRKLIEENASFRLRAIAPMPEPVPEGEESDWTPRFPGLSDAESCGEWDTGIPMREGSIRPRDEKYWDEYRGSPKAFVSLDAGQRMWNNRWGSLTGMRLEKDGNSSESLQVHLQGLLTAEEAGLVFASLRADAKAGVESPVDFSVLFLSFSFFVIVAALALTGMLFSFSMQQRNRQAGLLLALGFSRRKVRVLFLGEGFCISLVGVVLGLLGAWVYGKTILVLLSGEWSGAVTSARFEYAPSVGSVAAGGIGALWVSLAAMAWANRKQLKREPTELLNKGEHAEEKRFSDSKRKWFDSWIPGVLALIGSLSLAWTIDLSGSGASMGFFGVGSLLLASGILFFRSRLATFAYGTAIWMSATDLNRRNAGRRAGRSMVTVGVMAAGSFLVVSTGAFRKGPPSSVHEATSGTGGFSFLGESALPVYDDLNGIAGQDEDPYELNATLMSLSKVVPLRVRPGDDASCLNLNKAIRPTLYGVNPDEIKGRFSFAEGDWAVLDQETEEGVIPAVVDKNTMTWALKMKTGDRIKFLDGEGQPFFVELAGVVKGSMLQGALYLSEKSFLGKFPKQGGYRAFFLQEKPEVEGLIASHLEDRLQNYGMEFVSTGERLASLQKVENTYLSIFQGLGGLGLLLGTAGLAVVIVRNLVERGKEFALLEAVGYRLSLLRKLAFREHLVLGLWGLIVGAISAVVGIAPALFGDLGELPGMGFVWFFLALLFLSLFWTWLAVRVSLPSSRIEQLRDE